MCLSNEVHNLPQGCLWCNWCVAPPGNNLSPILCWRSRLQLPLPFEPSTGHSPCRQKDTYEDVLIRSVWRTRRRDKNVSLLDCLGSSTSEQVLNFKQGVTGSTHCDTTFFWIRKAEVPHSFHSRWWCAQSNKMSIILIQWCCHSDEKRGVPSPRQLKLHGLWVNAVSTSGSLCLIWTKRNKQRNNKKKCLKVWTAAATTVIRDGNDLLEETTDFTAVNYSMYQQYETEVYIFFLKLKESYVSFNSYKSWKKYSWLRSFKISQSAKALKHAKQSS